MGLFIFILIIVVLVVGGVFYSNVLAKRNSIEAALSSLDMHHKRRCKMASDILDILEKLLVQEDNKRFFQKFRDITKKINEAYDRSNPDNVRARIIMFHHLDHKIVKLLDIANTQDVTSDDDDEVIAKASEGIDRTKKQLAEDILLFNEAIDGLNSAIASFPGSVIAEFLKVDTLPHYEDEDDVEDEEE